MKKLIIILVFALKSLVYGQEGQYFKVVNNDCQYFNQFVMGDGIEISNHSWAGNCKEGYTDGSGVLSFMFRGHLDEHNGYSTFQFTGTMVGGKIDGKGTYVVNHYIKTENNETNFFSDTLTAVWKNGKLNGYGKYVSFSGEAYMGNYKDDQKHGMGEYTSDELDTYKGEWVYNKRSGKGISRTYRGDKYDGDWLNDLKHGYGTFFSVLNNYEYVGGFKNDKRHGKGNCQWFIGNKYEGEWVDDKMHGQGIFTSYLDDRQIGEFRNDTFYNGKVLDIRGKVISIYKNGKKQ